MSPKFSNHNDWMTCYFSNSRAFRIWYIADIWAIKSKVNKIDFESKFGCLFSILDQQEIPFVCDD